MPVAASTASIGWAPVRTRPQSRRGLHHHWLADDAEEKVAICDTVIELREAKSAEAAEAAELPKAATTAARSPVGGS